MEVSLAVMYVLKVRFLKSRIGYALYHRWMAWRGHGRRTAEAYIRGHAPGRSFLDVGGMWGINGAHSFMAEEAGAKRVVCLDLDRTAEFDERKKRTGSSVEFVQGDATQADVLERLGVSDVVWCFGVLYHVPDPHALLRSPRRLCKEKLLLESLTIPDVPGNPQAAMYFPKLDPRARRLWNMFKRGSASVQYGIRSTTTRRWLRQQLLGLSPSCVRALLETAGFRVDEIAPSPHEVFRHVFTCTPVD